MPIAIVGSGRSGTSMVAGMLSRCGLYMGEPAELVPPDEHNPNGYWEHAGIRLVTTEVLAYLSNKYGSAPLASPGWEDDPCLASRYEQAAAIVADFERRSQTWGWKYPPAGLILGFWRKVMPDLQVVLCVRNPLDVASSYVAFNPFDAMAARNLWLLHTAEVLQGTSAAERFVTVYGRYFPDYRPELSALLEFVGLPMPVEGGELDRALREFHQPKLKHHDSTLQDLLDDPEVSYLVRELFVELLAGDRHGSDIAIMKQAEVFMPFVRRAVAGDCERRHLEQILDSRTHRIASAVCDMLIKSPVMHAIHNVADRTLSTLRAARRSDEIAA